MVSASALPMTAVPSEELVGTPGTLAKSRLLEFVMNGAD